MTEPGQIARKWIQRGGIKMKTSHADRKTQNAHHQIKGVCKIGVGTAWLLLAAAILLVVTNSGTPAQTPRSAADYLNRGAARYAAGDMDGAITDFDKAIAINSGFVKAHGERGGRHF